MIQFAREGNAVEVAGAKALAQALANVGAKVIVFDGKGRPDVLLQAFESAIAQGVTGIVADGFDMDLVKTGVAAAMAANIPVLDVGASSTTPVEPPGVTAYVAVDAARVGSLQANYALAHTNCQLHTVTMPVSGGSIPSNMANGAVAVIKRVCPADCSIEQLEVNPATFISDLAGQVKTTLQRSPDLNYWITTADFFTPFILQGMRAVDRQLPIVGGAQGDGLIGAIKGTNGLVAVTLWPPSEIMGYIYADGIMRAVAGVPQSQVTPVQLVDSSNWGTSADVKERFPQLDSWRKAFQVAWRVKDDRRRGSPLGGAR
ncbi:MAG TPA: substrate-binding domain-containing protein [Bryobacteraceae bacterium]|nr:substrate-binding domain-containing protein [Bryobacteraceae bacterium]